MQPADTLESCLRHRMSTTELHEWLERTVDAAPPATRMPTLRECADRFGVSVSTVRRAFGPWLRGGQLVSVRGRGTFVASVPVTGDAAPGRTDSVTHLVDVLTGMIASGELRHGDPLPTHTFVVRQFGVTPRTVTTAYAELAHRGLVTRVGRRYRTGQPSSLMRYRRYRDALLVTWGGRSTGEFLHDDYLGLALGKMEVELQQFGYRLRAVPVETLDGIRDRVASGQDLPQGFVFYGARAPDRIDERIEQLSHAFGRRRRRLPPVVVVTTDFVELGPDSVVVNAGHIATVQARDCARWLVENGRSSVTVFIGRNDTTMPFERLIKLAPELLHLLPSARIQFVVRSVHQTATPDTLCEAIGARREWSWLSAMMNRYQYYSAEYIAGLVHLTPDLPAAYRVSLSSDAWVFPTTTLANAGRTWLDDASVPSNRRPSLITFDNTIRTRQLGLACCGPDWDRLGYLMAHCIVGDTPIERSRHGFLTCGSLMLPRETMR